MGVGLVACVIASGCGRMRFERSDLHDPPSGDATEASDAGGADDAADGAGPMSMMFASPIAASTDDAEEYMDGTMSRSSSDLELCDDLLLGQLRQIVGLRFTAIPLPAGATILSAAIQFTADSVEVGGGGTLVIHGQASSTAATFSSANNDISSRPLTVARVNWAPPRWITMNASGPDERTPDVSAIVQEIVSLPGWISGNELVFIVSGADGVNHATSFDGNPAGVAVLHVTYSG